MKKKDFKRYKRYIYPFKHNFPIKLFKLRTQETLQTTGVKQEKTTNLDKSCNEREEILLSIYLSYAHYKLLFPFYV